MIQFFNIIQVLNRLICLRNESILTVVSFISVNCFVCMDYLCIVAEIVCRAEFTSIWHMLHAVGLEMIFLA